MAKNNKTTNKAQQFNTEFAQDINAKNTNAAAAKSAVEKPNKA